MPIQYGDYVLWQRAHLDEDMIERQLAYWRERLGEEHPVLALPVDRVRTSARSGAGGRVWRNVSKDVADRLAELSREQGATMFMTLLAAWQLLLHRYSSQSEIRVGVPVAGRDRLETEGLVGFFVNTLVLRGDLSGSMTVADLIGQARERMIEAQANQDVPFARLVEALQPERSLTTTPLFQTMFSYDQADGNGELMLPGVQLDRITGAANEAQFDLMVDAIETRDGLNLSLGYAGDIFDATTVEQIADHFIELVDSFSAEKRLGALGLSVEAPARKVVSHDFGAIVDRIAEQAAARPDAEALTFGSEHVSYGALDVWSSRIGRRLQALGAGTDIRVGVCAERSGGLVAGLLGVLRSGAAYVPLDPDYPEERLAAILADSAITVVVADRASVERHAGLLAGVQVVLVDGEDLAAEDAPPLLVDVHPDELAYVIYTSGSTGVPKGVGVTHGNISRLLDATANWYRFGPDDVWTAFHSYAFDFSVWEMFGALAYGGRLVIVPHWTARDTGAFHALLRSESVTVLNQTPSAFMPLMHADLTSDEQLTSLRVVIFGGEKLEPAALRVWLEQRADRAPSIINMYGITETTVHVTYRPIGVAETQGGRSVIGAPIPDLTVELLDQDLNPVPVGAVGEIHVGGAGLARGYLGRPALTAERFIPNPRGGGGRLYRSGDLARRLADDIEYIGRNDFQVKIRGYRIELGEIEAALLAQPGVREAAVLLRGEGDHKRIIAWVIGDADVDALSAVLSARLPSHMVPSSIVAIDALPLTINGKLDREALPEPVFEAQGYVEPRNDVEKCLAVVWAEVLKLDRVSVTENFFALGGDSILSLQVIAKTRDAGWKITPKQLFEQPNIEALAQVAIAVEVEVARAPLAPFALSGLDETDLTALGVDLDEIEDIYPATPLQQGLLAIGLDDPDDPYHVEQVFEISGPLEYERLEKAWRIVAERHPILRTDFRWEDTPQILQVVRKEARATLSFHDWKSLPRAKHREAYAECRPICDL